jgi:hypothetical protein
MIRFAHLSWIIPLLLLLNVLTTTSFSLNRRFSLSYISRKELPSTNLQHPSSSPLRMMASDGIDPPQQSHFYSRKSYSDLKLSKYTSMVVKHLQLDQPSRIQALSFPILVNGTSCILADQTGSGKLSVLLKISSCSIL